MKWKMPKWSRLIATIVALASVSLMLFMLFRTASRFALFIQSYDLNTDVVTVGANSGIGFNRVPHDYMTIQSHDTCFSWTVDARYMENDSLMYYKINNVNPNYHSIDNGSITVNVPNDNGPSNQTITLTGADIERLISSGPEESKYVMLRTILQMHDASFNYLSFKKLRSCFYREDTKSPWGVIILDRYTTYVQPDGRRIQYVMAGRTDSIGSKQLPNTCKVQFYRMADYTIQPDEVDEDLFHIGKTHFLAKPVLVATQWGAGHAMITPSSDGLHISFPKAITYIERIDSLCNFAKATSGILTYQQNDGSFPIAFNLMLPAYSSAMSRDACNLRVNKDSLAIITSPGNSRVISSKFHCVPSFDFIDLQSGTGTLHVRMGLIDKRFILSYFLLPLLVFIILLVVYRWSVKLDRISDYDDLLTPFAQELPSYFTAVFSIAFAYAVCKTMIAFKLSYTYPYFEKLTGITTINVSFILLLVYTLSLIMNISYLKLERDGRIVWKRILVAPLAALFCLILISIAFKVMDHGINAETLSSYYKSELGGLNPLYWDDAVGMNDNHRTVPIILRAVNLILIILVGCLLVSVIFKSGNNRPARFKMNNYWVNLIVGSLLVFGASWLPGNYSTALITLLAILGLSRTLKSINYVTPQQINSSIGYTFRALKPFGLAMLACAIYFSAAMGVGDKGYLTNMLGYAFMGVLVYVMAYKTEYTEHSDDVGEEQKKHRNVIFTIIAACLVLTALFARFVIPIIAPAETVEYSRAPHRFNGAWQYEKYYNSGYRYAISDAEFMMIQDHYMYNTDGSDPLSNKQHILHSSLSTGQSPVILNDVSIQSSFFGAYGLWAFVVFFALLAILAWLVLSHTLTNEGHLSSQRLWRLMAILLWLSTSLYLYVSYSGFIPFTGRLIPGYGVDAVGEALETSLLLAFMTAVALKEPVE